VWHSDAIFPLLNKCDFFSVRPTNKDITAMNDKMDVADTI